MDAALSSFSNLTHNVRSTTTPVFAAREVAITDWKLTELMAQFSCVVNPNSTQPGILRIIMMPDLIWLGLYAVQSSEFSKYM